MFRNPKFAPTGRSLGRVAMEALEPRAYFSVDLTDSVSLVVPASGQVKTGSSVTLAVEVFNNGTTKATGPLAIDLSISPNADGSDPISFAPISRHIALKAGAHTTFRFAEKVPIGTTATTYFGAAVIDPGNTFGESDVTNNSAVSSNTVVVVPKYPNLDGTFSTNGIITRGFGKGETYTAVVDITGEDPATGKFTITGTDYFAGGVTVSYAGTGVVTTTGVFTESTTDIPADKSRVTRTHGKIVGNTSTFTFVSSIASGSGSSTPELEV